MKIQLRKNIFQYYDLAADVLAENAHLTHKYLTQVSETSASFIIIIIAEMIAITVSQYLYDYLDAVITQQTAPIDAYNKFEAMANKQINELRKLTKRINV